ncbi:metallophosphoesterase family protein [Martelella endophytica]|uniref:Metallophosphoesterase n=1 Tax=Martelella endophytica TaxID=1486262 RepID=A0A0D5LLA3_MAREN|nr:metallophosphoesterase family protein [Martelella endophytica]AJY44750.1 metallophosphoesterase [Martelella endophytica]
MRVAAIADIHGNIDALEAVLADIAGEKPDLIVNLGDCLSGPLAARATADRLMALDLPTVRGNHDRALIDRPAEKMGSWERPAFAEISEPHLDWIRSLPMTLVLEGEIYMCHATPENDNVMWMEELLDTGRFSLRSRARMEAIATGIDQSLILCGHSHVARSVMLTDGRLIVNPGSVGCPAFLDDEPFDHRLETGAPFASYALIEKTEAGWQPTFRQLRYDPRRMAALATERGYDDWARAVSTGWV